MRTGRFLLRDQLRAFHDANARLAHYDRCLADGLAEFRDRIHLRMTIPGIDRASAILVELGPDIGVFASRRHCAAWAGLCPGNNQSAGKRRHGRTRRGNLTLREVLIECAHAAARTHHCRFRGYYKALTVRRVCVYFGNIQSVADFTRVVGFQWDEGNARKSFDKHSVSQAEAEQVFFNEPLLVVEDVKHSRLEPRFHALGVTNSGRQLHVTFTLRGESTKIRVISARGMHSKERSRYEKET